MPIYFGSIDNEYSITIIAIGSPVSTFKVNGDDAAGEAWCAACEFVATIGGFAYLTSADGEVIEVCEG